MLRPDNYRDASKSKYILLIMPCGPARTVRAGLPPGLFTLYYEFRSMKASARSS
jgi:hypothetical protein